jgi:hypothetical protein
MTIQLTIRYDNAIQYKEGKVDGVGFAIGQEAVKSVKGVGSITG